MYFLSSRGPRSRKFARCLSFSLIRLFSAVRTREVAGLKCPFVFIESCARRALSSRNLSFRRSGLRYTPLVSRPLLVSPVSPREQAGIRSVNKSKVAGRSLIFLLIAPRIEALVTVDTRNKYQIVLKERTGRGSICSIHLRVICSPSVRFLRSHRISEDMKFLLFVSFILLFNY